MPIHFAHVAAVLTLAGLLAGWQTQARQEEIHQILEKGDEWTLQINGDQEILRLIGGGGGQTADGGFELTFDVAWGDSSGGLQAWSDAADTIWQVVFKLTHPGGAQTVCSGVLARRHAALMAGTCEDGRLASGAWYALRLGSRTTEPARIAIGDGTGGENVTTVQPEIIATTLGVEASTATIVRYGASSANDPPPIGSYVGRLTGVYDLDGPADSAQTRAFPSPPAFGSDLARWVEIHAAGLLRVLEGLYPASEVSTFLLEEGNRCNRTASPDFCSMAFRQQAIEFALGVVR